MTHYNATATAAISVLHGSSGVRASAAEAGQALQNCELYWLLRVPEYPWLGAVAATGIKAYQNRNVKYTQMIEPLKAGMISQ